MELEVTWSRTILVWWSLTWRNIIVALFAMILGFIFGFMVGFILGAMGVPIEIIKLIVTPIGFIIGLALSIFPIKMVLNKNYGEFRLVLLQNETSKVDPEQCAPDN